MRRGVSILLIAIVIFCAIPMVGFAQSLSQSSVITVYLENGDYIVEETTTIASRALDMTTGTKTSRYYDSNDVEQWRVMLTGTFSYNGTKATCTTATCDITIINTDWYTISKSANKSGNVARCSVTMGLKLLGVTIDQKSISLKLTCDPNGNLS